MVIAQASQINIASLLDYELAPVPLILFNLSGSMHKIIKSAILEWLEIELAVPRVPPTEELQTLFIVDLMLLLHMVCTDSSRCETFGDLSDRLLSILLSDNLCEITAIVGDNYALQESIKSGERELEGVVQQCKK